MKNYFSKFKFLFLTILFFGVFGLAENSRAATINATGCTRAEVSAAVALANAGDTVFLPACPKTDWSSTLNINKPLTLKGAGVDKTTLRIVWTSSPAHDWGDCYSGSDSMLIRFEFNGTAEWADIPVEISDITFDTNRLGAAIQVAVHGITRDVAPIRHNKMKIHHNKFINTNKSDSWLGPIYIRGVINGVIYNNYFEGGSIGIEVMGASPYQKTDVGDGKGISCGGYGQHQWNFLTPKFGDGNGVFIEDNIFMVNILDSAMAESTSVGWGGQLTTRYNDLYYTIPYISMRGGNQVHGCDGGIYPGIQGEFYGNKYINSSKCNGTNTFLTPGDLSADYYSRQGCYYTQYGSYANFDQRIMHCRGGKCLGFMNLTKNMDARQTAQVIVQNDNDPSYVYTASGRNTCPADTMYAGQKGCTPDGTPQHPHESYFFQNWHGTTDTATVRSKTTLSTGCDPDWTPDHCQTPPRPNIDFFCDDPGNACNSSCTSSACPRGVGCGPNVPIGTAQSGSGTCKTGTGYWVSPDSCSQLSGVKAGAYGDIAAKRITGTLYMCGPDNTWTKYFTPYTYPHPLRNVSTGNTTPAAPTGVRVI